MSMLIKGIDLPKESEHIDLRIWSDGIVAPFKGDTYTQAIQIDRPHGRLIDASTETTVKSMSGKAMDVGMLLIALKQFVPTILEAEE